MGIAVGIIGFGPTGLHGFERLLAAMAVRPPQGTVVVRIFDAGSACGRGGPWGERAPPTFLANNGTLSEIDIFGQTPPPITPRSTLAQWLGRRAGPATRAEVGDYLAACFRDLIDACPDFIAVEVHRGLVTRISQAGAGSLVHIRRSEGGTARIHCDQLLLATGHGASVSTKASRAAYGPAGAASAGLDACEAGSTVGLRGFGLTALDAILYLTEGRGGRFTTGPGDRLSYRASGREPSVIRPFSRTGLPPLPSFSRAADDHPRLFLFPSERLFQREAQRGLLRWQEDLAPLVGAEFELQYAAALVGSDAVDAAVRAAPSGDGMAAVAELRYRQPGLPRFELESLTCPHALRGAHHEWLRSHLLFVLNSDADPVLRAHRAALSRWFEISEHLEGLCRRGGIAAAGLAELRVRYAPVMRRVGFGTHPQTLRKLVALLEAGIVDTTLACRPLVRRDPHGWRLSNPKGDSVARVRYLIECRPLYQRPHPTDGLLYRRLVADGAARWRGDVGTPLARCVEVDPPTHSLVGPDGTPNPTITILGLPAGDRPLDNWSLAPDTAAGGWAARLAEIASDSPAREPLA